MSERDELLQQAARQMIACSHLWRDLRAVKLLRPMCGGQFGHGGFSMASVSMHVNGLHELMFSVIDDASGLVVSARGSKADAAASARVVLAALGSATFRATAEKFRAECNLIEKQSREVIERAMAPSVKKPPKVSRRRRQVLEDSGGACGYCGTVLMLDGKWHIDHKFPKSMGGTSERANLIAACIPCNLSKSDKTDYEFRALLNARRAAE